MFMNSDLLRHIEKNKELNDYFYYFEKNYKASIKRFFNSAHTMMSKFIPGELLNNLRYVLSELAQVMEGGCYKDTEISCLRQLQFLRHREEK
jgi:hypothetical protein